MAQPATHSAVPRLAANRLTQTCKFIVRFPAIAAAPWIRVPDTISCEEDIYLAGKIDYAGRHVKPVFIERVCRGLGSCAAMVGRRKISDHERRAMAMRNWPDVHATSSGIMRQLLSAVERLRQIFGPHIAAHGIQPGDFDVLATLRVSGAPYQLSPTAIYRQRCMSSGGLTKIVHRLEHAGLVRRTQNPDDRRSQLIRLTAEGKRVVEATMKDLANFEGIVLAGFRRNEISHLSGLLDKLHRSMDQRSSDA